MKAKKDALVRLLNAQYETEKQAELHTVPKLVEQLTNKILSASTE